MLFPIQYQIYYKYNTYQVGVQTYVPLFLYEMSSFIGIPGFRGYFFGVRCSFLMIITDRSLSSSGNVNVCMDGAQPPNFLIAFLACPSSSSALEPFIARKIPSRLHNGIHNSLNTDILATARAITMSKVARRCGSCPKASARACMNVTFFNLNSSAKCYKNVIRFFKESTMVISKCGNTLLSGMLRNPAPAPTSQIFNPDVISI